MGSKVQQRVRLRMAGLQQRGGGVPRYAAMERRQAQIDAVYGETRGFDAQGQDARRAREGVAFEVCVSIPYLRMMAFADEAGVGASHHLIVMIGMCKE